VARRGETTIAKLGFSPEHWRFIKTMRCPNGHFLFMGPAMKDATGRPLNKIAATYLRDKQATATCPKCDASWNVFGAATPQPADPPPTGWRVEEVRETHRFDQALGTDRQVVDATGFDSTVTQKLVFSRQWRQSVTVESEKAVTHSSGASVAILDLATLKASAETAIKEGYSTEESTERTTSREIEVRVTAGTSMEVKLHWKKVLQAGVVMFAGPNGATVEVPFALAVDVTFDQEFDTV
jgi:hypothetical protein